MFSRKASADTRQKSGSRRCDAVDRREWPNPVYGKSLYALSIEGRCSFLSAPVTQSPDGYPAR
jgi:hypothetical protein